VTTATRPSWLGIPSLVQLAIGIGSSRIDAPAEQR
jgi:hypothetical protein